MDLKPFIYRCALALLIGFATFTTINFYRAEKPFFIRLRQKKRVHYKIQKIKKHQSGICAQLAGEKSLLTFRLSFQNDDIIHVQINDSDCTRYVVQDVVTLHSKILDSRDLSMEENNNTLYIECMHFIITIVCDDFEMNIYRNGKQILSVNSQKLLLMEEGEPHVGASADFLFNAAIRAYGLPQHAEKLTLRPTGNKFYRLYNTDRFGYSSADCFQSLYGAVPLVYAHGSDQTTGLLWLNSSETFVGIDYTKIGVNSTFFSESGAIDFYVLSGPTFEDCVKQNSQLTGGVPLPPLFALGYHQSRFSYMSQEDVVEVSNEFDQHNFPLDSLWLDIDCTDDKKYFTWNPTTYPDPTSLFDLLNRKKRQAVVIIDPHIKVDQDSALYKTLKEEDFLIKNSDNTTFTAKCWPGVSTWLDFFNPKVRQFYAELHNEFLAARNLHVWNDMNEPALFETPENSMPKDVVHHGNRKHRDVHNLYGFYHSLATYNGLMSRQNLRPFSLTRSHFAGSQRFAAVWTGDNTATWQHLRISIPMCLTASLAGFSLCGADVGGFVKHPNDELLQRWYQLGAWLPFFRGHSNRNTPRREPYLYSKEVQQRIRRSLQQRYRHLLHWYTLFWQHQMTLEPVVRPLIYQYPHDHNVYDLDTQFLVGEDILVCPVTNCKQEQIDIYLPGGQHQIWYYVKQLGVDKYKGVGHVNMFVDMDTVPVFYRGGSIIPVVENPVKSSAFLQDYPITLYIFCDKQGNSTGMLYCDDRKTYNYKKGEYIHVRFNLTKNEISNTQIKRNSRYQKPITVGSINLYGCGLKVEGACLKVNNSAIENTITVAKRNCYVQLSDINVNVKENFIITLLDK